jgi:dolichol-phosphate mannosyltransferase
VIPATYNEAGNIEKFITVLEEEVFPKIKKHEMHILVADDYSPDGTGEIVKKLMKKYKNLGINQGERKGLGAAYLRTMGEAIGKLGADVVVSIDADFQFDPHDLTKFIDKIDQGYDVVSQTRYSGGGSIPSNWPFKRKLFSKVANLFVRTIFMKFYVHDWTGGFRALRKEVFENVKSEMHDFRGYIFQIAFLHKAIRAGFKIAEVPVHFSDRTLGNSKIAPLGYIIDVFKFVLVTRFMEVIKGSFGKFLVVGGFGFIINAVLYEVFVHTTTLPIAGANILAAQFAIFSNFNFNNLWTFKKEKSHNIFSYFLKMAQFFLSSNIGVIFIQSGTIQLGDILFGEQYYRIYFIIGTGFLVIWNFSMYRFVIWKKKKPKID